jgi:hypothetical protein
VVPGVAQRLLGKRPSTSSVFGYRNQPASKWLFLSVGVLSVARFVHRWRKQVARPRWQAGLDFAVALALLLGVPLLADVPLSAMARFNPDLVALLALGALASAVKGLRTLLLRPPAGAAPMRV